MAYFPNGTAGMIFGEQNCSGCANWKTREGEGGAGCPIIDAHMLGNYDQHDESEKGKAVKAILETLLPSDDEGFPMPCPMRLEAVPPPDVVRDEHLPGRGIMLWEGRWK